MSKSRRKTVALTLGEMPFAVRRRKPVPHEFVLDALAALSPLTRPMFGCLAVYVQDKIILILRDKPEHAADNGVWLATTEQHHQSLRQEFPSMRSIQVFGKPVTSWQVLPAEVRILRRRRCTFAISFSPEIPGSASCRSRDGARDRRPEPPRNRRSERR